MKTLNFLCILCFAALVVSGCLSTSKRPPDELAVIEGAPLWLPPNYELRPPGTATEASESAQSVTQTPATVNSSDKAQADSWLLDQAGANARDPHIRKKLQRDQDYIKEQKEKRSWLDKLTRRNPEIELKEDEAGASE